MQLIRNGCRHHIIVYSPLTVWVLRLKFLLFIKMMEDSYGHSDY